MLWAWWRSYTSPLVINEPSLRLRGVAASPQLGPRTEERDTFTRLLGHPLKGTEKGCKWLSPTLMTYLTSLVTRTLN